MGTVRAEGGDKWAFFRRFTLKESCKKLGFFLRCLPVERVDFLRADVASEQWTIARPEARPRSSKHADELFDPIQIKQSFQFGVADSQAKVPGFTIHISIKIQISTVP